MTDEERYFGCHTYAPSQAVMRNIKYQGNISERYSSNWVLNLMKLREHFVESKQPFIREIIAYDPGVILYTTGQKVGLEERKEQCVLLSPVSDVSPQTISQTATSVWWTQANDGRERMHLLSSTLTFRHLLHLYPIT
ncbi:unnamed protein product [Clavelina lepadiformis]|uniref:Uncharacterized protein n=1 Tax=Clavelina lepadiformis TaxID=159417 RepID=A0ABP0FTC1_CLALP